MQPSLSVHTITDLASKGFTLRRSVLLGVWVLLGACTAATQGEPVVIQGTAVPPLPTLDAAILEEGESLYATYCAACHGAALEGQPDWKIRQEDGSYPAPPHDSTGHTWHHPDELLLEIIARGGDPALGSKMPGFENTLPADKIQAILAFIKSHWGDEEMAFQWWITAR